MYQLGLEKAEEPEVKLPTFVGSWRGQRNSRKSIYFFFIDYAEAFECVDHNKLQKTIKEMGIPDPTYLPPEKPMHKSREQQLEPYMEQLTGSKLRKAYDKDVYCHLIYLTYMQRTWCEILGWMNHKLESRLLGEIPISDMQMISQ